MIENNIGNIEAFLLALEHETTTGELFLEHQRVALLEKPYSVCKFVYSQKYYFEFCGETLLWTETTPQTIISRMDSWLRSEGGRLQRTLGDSKKDQELSALIFKTIKNICRCKHLENVLKMIIPLLTDDSIFSKLDMAHQFLLPIRGVRVINLLTGQVRPRSITDYFTWECPVEPVKHYSEFFLSSISKIMCNNPARIDYLKKICGYCMTGSTEAQSYFVWYGKGGNGKSLILNLLQAMLGKASAPISKGVVVNCGKKSEAGTEILALRSLRVGTFSETCKLESLNEGVLKTISGGDTLTARGLYKDPISFKLFCKLIICTNHKPEFDGSDMGTARRIKLLPFDARFTREVGNPNRFEYPIIEGLEAILIEKHLCEFFTWCLEGCRLWAEDKGFLIIPDSIKEQQNQYIRSQNSFITWFNESVKPCDNSGKILRSASYSSYNDFCESEGIKKIGKKDFFEKMAEELSQPIILHGQHYYKDYILVEPVFEAPLTALDA